ncbi:MAG: amidohydrolase family protein, partial [Pyrinomonadaceae bacterium]
HLPVMIHAAESAAEKTLMLSGSGPFAAGLRQRNIAWLTPGVSSVQYLYRLGVLYAQPLLAHCINVDDQDIDIIKSTNAKVAHCPKSNAKLRHGSAPFAKFVSEGLRVGLGSDSVASNNTCDLLEEARFAMLLSRVKWFGDDRGFAYEVTAQDALRAPPGAAPKLSEWKIASALCARALRPTSPSSRSQGRITRRSMIQRAP